MLSGAIPGYNFHNNDTEEDLVLFLQSDHTLRLNCKHGCVRKGFNLIVHQTVDFYSKVPSNIRNVAPTPGGLADVQVKGLTPDRFWWLDEMGTLISVCQSMGISGLTKASQHHQNVQ